MSTTISLPYCSFFWFTEKIFQAILNSRNTALWCSDNLENDLVLMTISMGWVSFIHCFSYKFDMKRHEGCTLRCACNIDRMWRWIIQIGIWIWFQIVHFVWQTSFRSVFQKGCFEWTFIHAAYSLWLVRSLTVNRVDKFAVMLTSGGMHCHAMKIWNLRILAQVADKHKRFSNNHFEKASSDSLKDFSHIPCLLRRTDMLLEIWHNK